jgi:hypothetical protein
MPSLRTLNLPVRAARGRRLRRPLQGLRLRPTPLLFRALALTRRAAAIALGTLLSAVSCAPAPGHAAADADAPEWLLAPEPTGDLVRATDTEATLRLRLGGEHVRRDTVWLPEAEFVLGTVLFPDDPGRRLEVQWADTAAGAGPEVVRLGGTDAAVWRLAPGVGLGTSLAELERLNGRPFVLSGFGWDYGGTVDSWQGGRLDSLWGERVILRLRLAEASRVDLEQQVLGDVLYPSSHAAMRALDPRVYEVLVRPR